MTIDTEPKAGTRPDAGIHWVSAGTPDPARASLLFIHGAGANLAAWWQQFDHFAPARHVIAYDLAGFGRSAPVAPETLGEAMVAQAVAVIEAAGARRVHVICQSLGGWTGLRLALRRPDLVGKLVLCCTLAGIAHPPGLAAFQAASAKMDERGPASLGLSRQFEADEPAKAYLYRQLSAFSPPPDPRGAQRLFAPGMLVGEDKLADLAAETLLISGDDDPIWPAASLAGLVGKFRHARQQIIPGTGHSPYFERPAAFNRCVADFLGAD